MEPILTFFLYYSALSGAGYMISGIRGAGAAFLLGVAASVFTHGFKK